MTTKLEQLDLTRYRSGEIAQNLSQIVAFPQAILTVLKTTLAALALLILLSHLICEFGESSFLSWLISICYATLVSLILGCFLGIIRVGSELVTKIEKVLTLILDTSQSISEDIQSIYAGKAQLPSATEIVRTVYDQIVMPAFEKIAAESLGILSAPVLWIYRKTLGGAVRFLIIRMETDSMNEREQGEIESITLQSMEEIDKHQSMIKFTLKTARGYTEFVAGSIRRVLLRPLQIAFWIAAMLAIIPLAIFGFSLFK